MQTTRTLAAPVLALASLAFALVACGQDSATPSPTLATPTATPTAEPTPTLSPSPTVSPTADAQAPEGWRRITVAERGFSLAVPDEWEELSPDVIADSDLMDRLVEENPDAAAALEQAQAAIASGQIALFVFDTTDEGVRSGFATNLNAINVGPVEGTADEVADEIGEAIQQQIPITGEVQTDTVTLPAGDAARARYEWAIADDAGDATNVTVTQYAIIGDSGTGFIVSMSAASEAVDEYRDVFRQIAESFREEPA